MCEHGGMAARRCRPIFASCSIRQRIQSSRCHPRSWAGSQETSSSPGRGHSSEKREEWGAGEGPLASGKTRLMTFAMTSLGGSKRLLMAGMGAHRDQTTEWLWGYYLYLVSGGRMVPMKGRGACSELDRDPVP